MTTAVQATQQICDYLVANYAAAPLAFDNEPPIQRTDPYVRVSVLIGDSQANLDSTFKRTVGVLMLTARVLKGSGNLRALSLAEQAANIIELRTVGGVRLQTATYMNFGIVGDALEVDAGWHQVVASIPFWFERYT